MYKAKPLSRNYIRNQARILRKQFNLQNEPYFPVVRFVEQVIPLIDENFDLQIVEERDLDQNTYALTYPDESVMKIREDVYCKAIQGDGRARFTIAHEIYHYLSHYKERLCFARSTEKIPSYMDPEWQANTFAGELLVSYDICKDMDVDEIVERCGVSWQCANIQKQHH